MDGANLVIHERWRSLSGGLEDDNRNWRAVGSFCSERGREVTGALRGGRNGKRENRGAGLDRAVVVEEEEGLLMAVVDVRNPDRASDRPPFLKEAVAIARDDLASDEGELIEIFVGVESLIAHQKVKTAMIGIRAGHGIHRDHGA